jgi:hypothetical protein
MSKIEVKALGIYLTAKSSAKEIAQALMHAPQMEKFLTKLSAEK